MKSPARFARPCRASVRAAILALAFILPSVAAEAYRIHDDAMRGDADAVLQAIEQYPGLLEIRDEIGASPLYYAAWHGHEMLVRQLLERGAEATVATTDGLTPLHWAAVHGHVEICRMLLEQGADVNHVSHVQRNTPLHEVWNYGGHPAVARVLISFGAKIDATESWYGMSPLHYAVLKNLPQLARVLLELGADTTLPDKSGRTPAAYARTDEMKSLLDRIPID